MRPAFVITALLFVIGQAPCLTPTSAQAQDLPAAETRVEDPFRPLYPLIGRTFRGASVGREGVEDIARWDWAVGGHAVRVLHSVNGGAYGGETIIFPDKETGALIHHYFTSGGFHTTGVIRETMPGVLEVEEHVHGVEGLDVLHSRITLGEGGYASRTLVERDGQWVEFGGFDYRRDDTATPAVPARAGAQTPLRAGELTFSRRILADAGGPGDVAGYVRIAGGARADRLTDVSCACAERIELHRIDRSGAAPDMVSDDAWPIPEGGVLDVRPGSDLHLMLIGFDPTKVADGKMTLTLTFEQAGAVEAVFDLAPDSRSAWARLSD